MVVNPGNLKDKIAENDKEGLKRFESYIDDYILKEYNGTPGISIPIAENNYGLRGYVIEQLLDKYRNVGWTVKMEYGQREGRWLEFSFKKKNSTR